VASGVAVARGGAIRGDADGATLDGTTRGAGGVGRMLGRLVGDL